MSTRTKILAAVAALALLVIVLARGEEPSARLQALEDDPMATYVPAGGTLVDADSQNEGTSLGRPVSATYARMFELGDGVAAERELGQARTAAIAAGWKEAGTGDARAYVAHKRVPSGRTELTLTLFRDSLLLPDGVSPPALLVTLRHLGP